MSTLVGLLGRHELPLIRPLIVEHDGARIGEFEDQDALYDLSQLLRRAVGIAAELVEATRIRLGNQFRQVAACQGALDRAEIVHERLDRAHELVEAVRHLELVAGEAGNLTATAEITGVGTLDEVVLLIAEGGEEIDCLVDVAVQAGELARRLEPRTARKVTGGNRGEHFAGAMNGAM